LLIYTFFTDEPYMFIFDSKFRSFIPVFCPSEGDFARWAQTGGAYATASKLKLRFQL
jgi:hypothetical protein